MIKIKHLSDANKGYGEHFAFAFKYGFILIGAGIASLIHGLLPWFFKFTSARTVLKIARIVQQRGTPGEQLDD